jgi:hypothetical protein
LLIADHPTAAKHDTHVEPPLSLGNAHLAASTSSLAIPSSGKAIR